MDALSLLLFVLFGIGVIVALAFVDMAFGDYDDKEDWRRR